MEPTKTKVLAVHKQYGDRDAILRAAAGDLAFYNTSPLTLQRVLADPTTIADQFRAYLAGFSEAARDVIEKFEFDAQITRLARANLLYLVVSRFCDPQVDLHPDKVSNLEMGYLYEELVRRFSELSNETAGEHFTPREVIRLMVDLLLTDEPELHKPGILKTLLDPACGTGGMLSISEQRLRELNPEATLKTYGQELNPETYAVCRSDMMIKGQDADNIAFGNSFSEDAFDGERYDYLLANPPFGVEWKKVAALAVGPDVWEVISALRYTGGSDEERVAMLAEQFDLHARHIRTAIDFAAAHRELIDEQIATNDAAAERARRLAEQRASLMAS